MIKFENTEVVGWDAAIRGMRSDTGFKYGIDGCVCNSSCAKYLRMITVYVDITAPLYWWKEFDAYKVDTAANSCSTMHKITSEEFDMGSISGERLSDDNHYIMYNAPLTEDDLVISPKQLMNLTIDMLNYLIESYDNEKDQDKKKDIWYSIIQLLPSSYNQKRTVILNYEVLANIYKSHKTNKLDEWREHGDSKIRAVTMEELAKIRSQEGFCDWIKTLPYSELIVGDLTESETVELFADGKKVATFEDKPLPQKSFDTIENFLARADAVWHPDLINNSIVVRSKNVKEPLTEQEQECFKQMWRNQGFSGDIIFYVGGTNC